MFVVGIMGTPKTKGRKIHSNFFSKTKFLNVDLSDLESCFERNYELTIATHDEQLQINQLIKRIDFKSILLNSFSDAISIVGSGLTAFASSVSSITSGIKTFFTFGRYRLIGKSNGSNADFRIQSSSKTYSHVVMKVGKVYGVTKIQDAFTQSCNCGQTVYLE